MTPFPNQCEFERLAAQGNLIPVTRQILADFDTPVSAYWKLRGQGEAFLFESVEGGDRLGRYSFVGCDPKAIIRQWEDQVELREKGKLAETYRVRGVSPSTSSANEVRDALEVVERYLNRYRPVPLPRLPNRFTGGAVGFIGYEFIHDVEPAVPKPERNELSTPTVYFLIADELLVFDRVQSIFCYSGSYSEKRPSKMPPRPQSTCSQVSSVLFYARTTKFVRAQSSCGHKSVLACFSPIQAKC